MSGMWPGSAAWSRAEAAYLTQPDAPECPECGDYIEEDADSAWCASSTCGWRVDRPEPEPDDFPDYDDRYE